MVESPVLQCYDYVDIDNLIIDQSGEKPSSLKSWTISSEIHEQDLKIERRILLLEIFSFLAE